MTQAQGGTVSYANGKKIHTFNSSGTFVVTEAGTVEALVVAGGGGGFKGGGGGGGVIYTAALTVGVGNVSVTVGDGGTPGLTGSDTGGASIITDGNISFTTQTAIGGGKGGGNGGNGKNGGSGGGGGPDGGYTGGTGTVGQGNNGGVAAVFAGGGGGGGAGAVGGDADLPFGDDGGGDGGLGLSYSISGAARTYGGGGGGQSEWGNRVPSGGGGGGNGANIPNGISPSNGTANTGGGGGGGGGTVIGEGGSGVVIFSYDSDFTTGRRVAQNEDLADMTASTIKGRITSTGIPQDLTSTQVAGILVSHFQPLDSDLTSIAGLSPANDDIVQRKAGAWTNRTLAQYKTDIHLENINVDTIMTDSKDPTGWVDPTAITVSYDSTARTITLTGTLEYYWRGVKTTLASPWTSSAHTATNGSWFLSSTDGTNFTWSTTVWTFDTLMVAFVNYGATYKFALRETHGLMQWQTHEELHATIGTFKESGGTLSNYTLLSTTAANRRPDVAATHLHDEDNETTNAALTSKLYNKLYLAGSIPTITYTGETADIVPLLGNNPYYNAYAAPNWQQTLMSNNSYMCVWLVAIPTAADATSQTYRYTWVQGQANGNLASQVALTPSDLNLAAFSTEATEFVFLAKVIIRYTGGNWDLYSVTTLTGNRMIQVGSPAGAYLSSVATDATLTGDGSLGSPLGVVALGTPTSGVMTNATGLPLTTGVTGILPAANGGTGANNGAVVLTIAETMSAAGRNVSNNFTANQGINITPTSPLHVAETRAGSNSTFTIQNMNSNATDQVRAEFIRGVDTGTGVNKGMVLYTGQTLSGWADYESRSLGFFTGAGAAATQKLRIWPSGGITAGLGTGITDPGTSNLHVIANLGVGRIPSVQLDVKGGASYAGVFRSSASDANFLNIGASTYGYIGFNNTIGTKGIIIASTGNVGINTTTTTAKLNVVGDADTQVLILKAHSTQTANVFETQTSSAAVVNSMSLTAGTVLNEQGDAAIDLRAESDANTHMLFLDSSANAIGINNATPTAYLHVGAGSATAGTAPIKLTAGTSLTTPEAGTIEFDGSNFFLTI